MLNRIEMNVDHVEVFMFACEVSLGVTWCRLHLM